MDAAKFEGICTRNGFSPKQPIDTPHGRVLIAERYFNYHVEYQRPHWQTIWAFDRDGIDIAQKVYFDFGAASVQSRRKKAAEAASQWIKDNLTVGRYKN